MALALLTIRVSKSIYSRKWRVATYKTIHKLVRVSKEYNIEIRELSFRCACTLLYTIVKTLLVLNKHVS